MRATKNLDAFNGAQFVIAHAGAIAVHPVHIQAHGRLEAGVVAVRADAPDSRRRANRFALSGAQQQAWGNTHQVMDIRHSAHFDLFRHVRGNGQRHIADGAFPARGGNDDFFKNQSVSTLGLSVFLLRRERRRNQQGKQ